MRYRQAILISHQISEFLKRQLLYNIPYHSASLLDEVLSLNLKEERKEVNDLKVIGDQYDIMFQNVLLGLITAIGLWRLGILLHLKL